MPEFRIRVEFDVEVDNPSHIAAAFAAADWLQQTVHGGRARYLVYEVASTTDLKDGEGTQFKTVDLDEIAMDAAGEFHPVTMPNIGDTCCGQCSGGTCYVDQITGA